MSQKPNDEQNMLSFEELKGKLQNDKPEKDPEMDALLADLREISDSLPEVKPEKAEAPKAQDAPKAKTAEEEKQEYKSIFDDVMKSVMETSEEDNTTRKSKFANTDSQFVDVTKAYEDYGTQAEKKSEEDLTDYMAQAQMPTAADPAHLKEYRSFNEIMKDFFRKVFPIKGDSVGEGIRKIVADLAVIALVFCVGYFAMYGINSYKAKKQQAELSGYVLPEEVEDVSMEGDEWAEFISKYPNVQFPEGMMQKYAYLYAINPDLVGWINVPGTMINVQVVQTETNEAEYLHKDFYGEYSRYGTPYMDYRNDPKYLNQNTTIYGHHMQDGLVFADLKKYKTVEGFKENPVFYFDTLYKKYAFKVYAVIISNAYEEDDNGYLFNYTIPNFKSGDHFMSYIAALDERKLYTTGVDIKPDDKLLTISTCTYEFDRARLAVVGRMVREGEDESVDVELAQPNPSPRYPQKWYDKKGQPNPYADAPRWMY